MGRKGGDLWCFKIAFSVTAMLKIHGKRLQKLKYGHPQLKKWKRHQNAAHVAICIRLQSMMKKQSVQLTCVFAFESVCKHNLIVWCNYNFSYQMLLHLSTTESTGQMALRSRIFNDQNSYNPQQRVVLHIYAKRKTNKPKINYHNLYSWRKEQTLVEIYLNSFRRKAMPLRKQGSTLFSNGDILRVHLLRLSATKRTNCSVKSSLIKPRRRGRDYVHIALGSMCIRGLT